MGTQTTWFISPDGDGKRLQLKSTGEPQQAVEIDRENRLCIPAGLSSPLKNQTVRLFFQEDHLVVIREDHFITGTRSIGISGSDFLTSSGLTMDELEGEKS